ncbi:MAG: hypothetical protein AAF368_03950 [Planctomycetota bacterium]
MPAATTARRRWTREVDGELDGIAISGNGPVLLHGYDPPAGGKWVDEVIPGRLAAVDRASGEITWNGPCEVGYGRGFAAGFGPAGDVIVLGPSSQGHRAVRMSRESGELKTVEAIRPFDEGLVGEDVCITVTAGRLSGLNTEDLTEVWEYSKTGERFHRACRIGNKLFVSYTDGKKKKQGVQIFHARSGKRAGMLVEPTLPVIHDMAAGDGEICLLTESIMGTVPQEMAVDVLMAIEQKEEGAASDTLSLLTLPGEKNAKPLWFEILATRPQDELPEVGIAADSAKLYLVQGAGLEVRDMVSGRALGGWTVPGLDERIDWQVADGACLVAEETRASIFELPA